MINEGEETHFLMSVWWICFFVGGGSSNTFKLHWMQWIRQPTFLQRDASPPSPSLRWPRPQNRRRPSTICSQARAVCEETWAGWNIQSPGRRGAGRWIKRRRRRRSVWFARRLSGQEHVSREWATGNGIIVIHSRETQEGPGTGNPPTRTDTRTVVYGTARWVPLFMSRLLRFGAGRDVEEDRRMWKPVYPTLNGPDRVSLTIFSYRYSWYIM